MVRCGPSDPPDGSQGIWNLGGYRDANERGKMHVHEEELSMATAVVTKDSMLSQADLITWLNSLAEELGQLGFADEAARTREIANEVDDLQR